MTLGSVKKVRLIADARREFYEEITYYEKQRLGLGKRFRRAAEAAFLEAGENPEHGKPGVGGTRRLLVRGFPFSVVYLESEHEVMVYAVAHLSRSPEYWVVRLRNDG